MKRFLLSLLYMLMLLPGLISIAMILWCLPGFIANFEPLSWAWSDWGLMVELLLLWIACFVISWSGWRLLKRLYATADRY